MEIFKYIDNSESFFVSNIGNVKRIKYDLSEKIISRSISSGYYMSYIRYFSGAKNCLVHRLMWEAFNGIIPEGYEVHHKDGDRSNCTLDNLEIHTCADHARIKRSGLFIGSFDTEEEARIAYNLKKQFLEKLKVENGEIKLKTNE